ncbi:MAG: Rpn family recombination-promoting nuclease/putative transposase [Blautia sp.]|nr:Rpn family recombination-promoting nuclease/putative transposase [Blautia sp.]
MSTNESNLILNSKLNDSSSKIIFDEPLLCAQFLRDYIEGIPCLKDVQPEDIEDVSERYVPLFAEERNSDRVKKVHVKNGTPFFLVSLIEHKTKVEYNVTMQIFRYMVYIWETYERDEEKLKKGISRQKDFKYPPILPIVYYEGRQEWTVPLDFKSRIIEGDAFSKYIPDFQYYLVPLRKYRDQDLLDKKDEISLVMLINRLQEMRDISSFRSLPQAQLETVLKSTPDHIVDIIADMLLAFLLKSNVSADEAEEVVGKVREKNMGQLFADMEPIDIQAEQAKIRAQRQEIAVERQKIADERQKIADERQKIADEQQKIADEQQKMADEQQKMADERQKVETDRQEMNIAWQEIAAEHQKLEAQKRELELMKQEMEREWARLKP